MSNQFLRFNSVLFFLVLSLVLATSVRAFGFTGSGDSDVGALETLPPEFSGFLVEPALAATGETVTITFSASETLDGAPVVTVNGNAAHFVSEAGNYTFEYTVQEIDASGMVEVVVSCPDLVGNVGVLSNSLALEIVQAPPTPAVPWWMVSLALLVLGLVVLRVRNVRGPVGRVLLIGLLLGLTGPMAFAQWPTVSNVTFMQDSSGSGTHVDITYDLTSPNGPCNITVLLSKDAGADGFVHPVTSVTGAVAGVSTGMGHLIVWDIAADYPNENIPQAQVRVVASDYVPEMIPVAAGQFDMGNSGVGDDATYGYGNELPVHTVTLSAYEIGKFAVTNQEVCDVYNWANDNERFTTLDATTATAFGQDLLDLGSGTCLIEYSGGMFTPETRTGLPGTTTYSMAVHPAVEISWYGAVAYCNWLSEIAGLTPVYDTSTWTADFENDGFHLPTEAQWERAAAWDGSKHWIYAMVSSTLTGKDRCNYGDDNPNSPNWVNPLGLAGYPYTSPVGWFDGGNVSPNLSISTVDSPSPVGAYDMSGNVWEWCHDRYDGNYYTTGGSSWNDPTGPGLGSSRVLRGGSWNYFSRNCRCAYRHEGPPVNRNYYTGFRVARTPSYAGFVHAPEMIPVAAGQFDMGNSGVGDDATYGQADELPVHTVTLSDYEIGKFEVTNQEVCDVYNWANDQGYFAAGTLDATTATAFGQELLDLGAGTCPIAYSGGVFTPEMRTGLPGTTTHSMAVHPAVEITWYGAVAYCNWLSEIAGLTPVYNTSTWTANFANDGFHLPTEAQWERAAAWDGSKHWIYAIIYDELTSKDRCSYQDVNPNWVNPLGLTAYPRTSPVGWFDGVNVSPNGSILTVDSPSPVGAYDMSGNVWEWCHDRYDDSYYTTGGPPWNDPTGPVLGSDRVLRGGSWLNLSRRCRCAFRVNYSPTHRYSGLGFRVASTGLKFKPQSVIDIERIQPFQLEQSFKYDWRLDYLDVWAGLLVVFKVDPDLVTPRNALEPVLYAGNQTVQRLNHGHESGFVIGIIPEQIDLSKEPAWFGTPALPERIDTQMIARERAKAERAGISALKSTDFQGRTQDPVVASDLTTLLREHAANLVLEFSPQEKWLADSW